LLSAIWTVNAVLAFTVSRLAGCTNLAEGMFELLAITPIGAGLHEPPLICWPLVIGFWTVAQKLMKLLTEVKEATWPAAGVSWPSFSKPVAITLGSRA
jgi:hypothetical protein